MNCVIDTGKTSILLVEDEVIIAQGEKRELERYGYAVTHAVSGEEAVRAALAEGARFDLVLMDINLGQGMDGTEAARQIIGRLDIPVVFLSSHTDREIVEKTEKITSYGYVVKKSGMVILDASIKMALKLFNEKMERARAEKTLRESEERYRLITENAGDNISIYDLNLRCIYSSPAVERMIGYTPEEIVGQSVEARLTPDSLAQARQAFEEEMFLEISGTADPARKRKMISEEYHKDGSLIWVEDTFSFLRDADGRPTAILSVSHDVTDRKRAEQEIQRQLSEKETLLLEVHHRVKNNINAIASLLGLSANAASSEEARDALLDAQNRVMSMGTLYERLLMSGDYASLSVKTYMEELVAAIGALSSMIERPEIVLSVEDMELSVKKLFPLGLVVNELVSNAFKHAFPEGTAGRVEVTLARRGNTVTFTVRDNGRGLPEGFDPAKSTGFGLMLVGMLAKQLGGTFTARADCGTVCILDFVTE